MQQSIIGMQKIHNKNKAALNLRSCHSLHFRNLRDASMAAERAGLRQGTFLPVYAASAMTMRFLGETRLGRFLGETRLERLLGKTRSGRLLRRPVRLRGLS